jgi:hypothetical protein
MHGIAEAMKRQELLRRSHERQCKGSTLNVWQWQSEARQRKAKAEH